MANHENLEHFQAYEDDRIFDTVDMLAIATDLRFDYFTEIDRDYYSVVVTDMGLCLTTAILVWQPRITTVATNRLQAPLYGSLDIMKMNVSPHRLDERSNLTIVSLFV